MTSVLSILSIPVIPKKIFKRRRIIQSVVILLNWVLSSSEAITNVTIILEAVSATCLSDPLHAMNMYHSIHTGLAPRVTTHYKESLFQHHDLNEDLSLLNTSKVTFTRVMARMFHGPSSFHDNVSTGGLFVGPSFLQGDASFWDKTQSVVHLDEIVNDSSFINSDISLRGTLQVLLDTNHVYSSPFSFNQTLFWENFMAVSDRYDGGAAFGSRNQYTNLLFVASLILFYIYKRIPSFHRATAAFRPFLILQCLYLICFQGILAVSVALNDTTIQEAVNAWISDPITAKAVYGPIETWNTSLVTKMDSLFFYKQTFNEDLSGWDTSQVTSMNSMFMGATIFNGNVSTWDTSSVTEMGGMFNSAYTFNGDLSKWNIGKVTNIGWMFYVATSFNGNVSTWNTSNVVDMSGLFNTAKAFNRSVAKWDTSRATNMAWIFSEAYSYRADSKLAWNISSVTNMYAAFYNAPSFNGDISSWDTSKVTRMDAMFNGASSFNGNISTWNTMNVSDMSWMFSSATSFNGNLSLWDTSMVTTMYAIFYLAPSFNGDISLWNIMRVANMGAMFNRAISFNGVLSNWNMSSVRDTRNMFQEAVSFNRDLMSWKTSRVTDMSSMFKGASLFNGSLAFWDTSSVTDISFMFSNASSYNRDFLAWNIGKLRNMVGVFYNATSFNGDLSSWDTSTVTNMVGMFNSATSFNRDLSSFNTSLVFDLSYMFNYAVSFNNNLSSWDTSSVKTMKWTFYRATKFNYDLSKWITSGVTDMNSMFHNATSFNGNILPWDTSRVLDMSELFVGAKAFNQTLCWNTSVALKDNLFEDSRGSFSALAFPSCLISAPTPNPSARPTYRSSHKPTIWPKPWTSYTSLLYGISTSDLTFNHTSCPEGSKVVRIWVRSASWINQLLATCDDKGNTVLGPWGQLEGSLEAVPPCTEGYNGWNITYGSYIGQIAFACASSSFSFLSPLGSGLAFGAGSTNHTLLSRNQSIIGFQVYYDSLGIHAMKFEYAELPSKGRCLNAVGDPTGRCPSKTDWLALLWGFLVMSGVFVIFGFIFSRIRRRRHKMMFKARDTILPLK